MTDSKPFDVAVAELQLALADIVDFLGNVWDEGLGRLVGTPWTLRDVTEERRRRAQQTIDEWSALSGEA